MPSFPALNHLAGGTNSAKGVLPVTKSNANNVFGVAYNTTNGGDARACRGLLVGTAGAQTIVDATGTERTNVPLQAGYNPIQCIQIKTTGTNTADNIWALI